MNRKIKALAIVSFVMLCASPLSLAQTGHKAVVNQGSSPVVSGENWKGAPYDHLFDIHGGVGMGIFEGNLGLALIFGAAFEIAHEGFIGDGINDQVYLEISTGPLITSGLDPWAYSVHIRWDFHMDLDWTFYSLGGLGGSFGTGVSRLYPRFGAGIVRHLTDDLGIRGEISQNWILLGMTFGF